MTLRKRWLLAFLSIGALSVLSVDCAAVLPITVNCDDVQILSHELTAQEAEEFCHAALNERKKVEAFWGNTWNQPIRIHVASSYLISRALIPAYQGNRGFMEMPLARVRDKRGALLHEIVHIYAPNRNRFLAEGLAVYLQDKMGDNPAFPNFGKDLHALARQSFAEVSSLKMLNDVRKRPLSSVMAQPTAYILAGSFVGFLIQEYGLPRFKSLYETGTYDEVYRKSLSTLEKEWRMKIGWK